MANPFDINASPVTEPESLLTGSFAQWRRLFDYSDDDYSLAYRLVPGFGGTPVVISGTFDASNKWWVFKIPNGTQIGAGTQRWDLLLTRLSDDEVVSIATGSFVVHGTTTDRRTHAEVMVAKIESLLIGRADADIESYSIKSRQITKMSVKELREWREYYLAEIQRTGGSTTGGNKPKANTLRVGWR